MHRYRTTIAAWTFFTATAATTTATAGSTFLEPTVALHDIQLSSNFGWAVSELTDIDGDGADDLVASAPGGNYVRVYSGRTGALLHHFSGSAGQQYGYAIADAGDVNMDGTADVIIGAPGAGAGFAHVRSGAPGGAILLTLSGEAAGDFFGAAVSGAGDIDDDGHADLLVGAINNDTTGTNSGRAYLFSGATGDLIRTLESESSADLFGGGTARAGDVNGDGVEDHIVSAYNGGFGSRGEAYVFSGADGSRLLELTVPEGTSGSCFGQFFVSGLGLIDGDNVPDLYVGDFCDFSNGSGSGRAYVFSGADGSVIHNFEGAVAGEGLGPGRGAGDVDHDGVNDVIVGGWTSSAGASLAGKLFIFSGATGETLRTITSLTPNEHLGFDAVGVGDVNDDGEVDFLASGATVGQVYLVLGSPAGDFDGDGDVDGDDLASFESCYTGPSGGDIGVACATGDFDDNGTIDCHDFIAFEAAWTEKSGPALAAVCDCNVNGVNDVTDIAEGTLADTNGDDIPDACQTQTPIAAGAGGRYLVATPQGPFSQTPIAIEIRPLNCFGDPFYVTESGGLSETPVFRSPVEWGTVTISGPRLVPGNQYAVGADEGSGASGNVIVSTWNFGDANGNGIANFEDIQLVVQGFQSNFSSVTPEAADLLPCMPNSVVNFEDVQAAVLGFQGAAFATLCTGACP